MPDNNDFKIVPASRSALSGRPISGGADALAGAAADNFSRILDIAESIVETAKMKVQSDTYVASLREQRLALEREASLYVDKLRAETDATIGKVDAIRRMMQDYYVAGRTALSGEEFSRIISDVLDRMGSL